MSLESRRLLWERHVDREIATLYDPDPYGPGFAMSAASTPGVFVLTRGQSVVGCSLEDGHILWRVQAYVPYHWPTFHEGLIPLLSRRDSRADRFLVIDDVTGDVRCDRVYRELAPVSRQRPGVVWGTEAIFVSESGHIAVFSLVEGDLLSLSKHAAVFWWAVVVDGRLLVGADDGHIWVFEPDATPTKASGSRKNTTKRAVPRPS